MVASWLFRNARISAAALVLVLSALAVGTDAQGPPFIPRAEVQNQGYSISADSPSAENGLHPADILGPGGIVLIPCDALGLLCFDFESDAVDDISALSFGVDFDVVNLPQYQYSVGPGASGAPGSPVAEEAACNPSEAQADVFEAELDARGQDLDGNGTACDPQPSNAGFGLGLSEAANGDDVDALAQDPCLYVDTDCDGNPEQPIYFTLAAGSPSLEFAGATPADILVAGVDYFPYVWASADALGLVADDTIDGLCINEDGDGQFGDGDVVLFSLAAGSPSLTSPSGPGDLLAPGPVRRVPASALGLQRDDDLDALACAAAAPTGIPFEDIFLPYIDR